MDDDGAVAEEGFWARGGGEVEIEEAAKCVSDDVRSLNAELTYAVEKDDPVMLPCLPARSPSWHEDGSTG